jgi:hypothetical protein
MNWVALGVALAEAATKIIGLFSRKPDPSARVTKERADAAREAIERERARVRELRSPRPSGHT